MEMEAGVGVVLDYYVTAMSDLVFQGVFRATEYHDNITFVTKLFVTRFTCLEKGASKYHVLRAFTYSFVYDLSLVLLSHNKSELLRKK